jgi:hypothetical protein
VKNNVNKLTRKPDNQLTAKPQKSEVSSMGNQELEIWFGSEGGGERDGPVKLFTIPTSTSGPPPDKSEARTPPSTVLFVFATDPNELGTNKLAGNECG